MSPHCLSIEYGRHKNTERLNRLCNQNSIEGGFHFVAEYNFYNAFCIMYIPMYLKPNIAKIVELLKNEIKPLLYKIPVYIKHAFKKTTKLFKCYVRIQSTIIVFIRRSEHYH